MMLYEKKRSNSQSSCTQSLHFYSHINMHLATLVYGDGGTHTRPIVSNTLL